MQWPNVISHTDSTNRAIERPFLFACNFYGLTPVVIPPTSETPDGSFTIPFVSAFESLASLSQNCAQSLVKGSENVDVLREVFAESLLLIDRLAGRLGAPVKVAWDTSRWLQAVLRALEHEVGTIFDL